jgi:hypothetical protein
MGMETVLCNSLADFETLIIVAYINMLSQLLVHPFCNMHGSLILLM